MTRPNILWIQVDDINPDLGCYGEAGVDTPNIDRLASEGVLFRNAYSTSPICSPARSAAITGAYQTSINAHQHRSYRYSIGNPLPAQFRLIPEILRDNGYYTVLAHVDHPAKNRYLPHNPKNQGKADYNFSWNRDLYDAGGSPGLLFDHWPGFSTRQQPFFAQVQLRGGKFRTKESRALVDEVSPTLPPYYPNHPAFIDRWRRNLASINHLDTEVGLVLDQLDASGFRENTAVFFFSDHGPDNVRHKQTLYDGGIHIPLIIRPPAPSSSGSERSDLVSQIDVAASSLGFAGIPIPREMHGRDLFATEFSPRSHIVAARDRSGANVDRVRCVRTHKFKYIRNFYPDTPYFGPDNYMFTNPVARVLRKLQIASELDAIQSRFLAPTRPPEELYDLQKDPHEIDNLAEDPARKETLRELSETLDRWIENTGDLGATPEPEEEKRENTWYHRQKSD